jgi:N-acyl-D-aspartate/D-glutamate deacylase
MRRALLVLFPLVCFLACTPPPQKFDLVLVGGRVIDPETGLDAIRNIGVRGDLSSESPQNRSRERALSTPPGSWFAPGFIDLHQHGRARTITDARPRWSNFGTRTGSGSFPMFVVLSMCGKGRASSILERQRATSQPASRRGISRSPRVSSDLTPASFRNRALPQTSAPPRSESLRSRATLNQQIEAGALGIGMGLEYAPGATRHEVIEVFRAAAKHGEMVFVHLRSGGRLEPGSSIEALARLSRQLQSVVPAFISSTSTAPARVIPPSVCP